MADLLVIDGVIPAEAGMAARVNCQRPVTARIAPGLHLPMAGAVLLHLAVLILAMVASRLGDGSGQAAVVYPIRLYSAAEVAASVPGALPDPVASPVRRSAVVPALQPPTPVQEMTTAAAGPRSDETVPLAAAPAPVVQTVAPARSAGNGGLPVVSGTPPSFPAQTAEGMEVAAPMANGVARVVTADPAELPEQVAHPLYRQNPGPEDPALARRRQQEGTVVLEALVTPEGRVGGLALHRSSGYPLLDEAALKGVKGWRFEPGRRGAAAVAMKVLVPVRFGLR